MAAGDIAIYRESTGGGVFGTTAAKHAWDTTVTEGTPFSLGSGTDVTVSEAGYYLAIHNIGVETQAAQTGRSKVLSYIDIDGVEQDHGQAAGFFNRTTGVDFGGGWSAGIFRVEAGEVVSVKSRHSDSNTSNPPKESAAHSGLQLLQLDSSQPILRLWRASAEVNSSTSWRPIRWSNRFSDYITRTTDAFNWAPVPTEQNILLKKTGKYLVCCTIGVSISSSNRAKAEMRMTLGGVEVPRSYASDHVQGLSGCNDGVMVSTFILDNPTSLQNLVVEYRHSTTGPSPYTPSADTTTISIQKIPDWPETIRTGDTAGGAALSTTATFSWDTAVEYDESDQDSFTFTAPSATILADQTDNYLFLGSLFGQRPSGASAVAFQPLVQVNAVNLTYGMGNGYSRATDDPAAQASYGGIIQATATNTVITQNIQRGATDAGFVAVAERSGCEIINIASLFGATRIIADVATVTFTAPVPSVVQDVFSVEAATVYLEAPYGTHAVYDTVLDADFAGVTMSAPTVSQVQADHKPAPVASVSLTAAFATFLNGYTAPDTATVSLIASPLNQPFSAFGGTGVSDLSYSPSAGVGVVGSALSMEATITGQASVWNVLTNPWDAVQCPGPDQDPDSELYVGYADPNDAYIEIRPTSIVFLQGPYASGGLNPVRQDGFQLDGVTAWTGVADGTTMGDRYGFGVAGQNNNFTPVAEGIYWAGSLEADTYRDAENRIIVRVSGDVALVNPTTIRIGGPGTTTSNQEAWWTEESGRARVTETPRRISGLWIVGASVGLGALGTPARGAGYSDSIAEMTFGELYYDFTTGAPSDFSTDDITYQGLAIRCQALAGTQALGGTGNIDYDIGPTTAVEVRHGLIRVFDCQILGTPGTGGHEDKFGVQLGLKWGIRFFHSRGMFHLHNVHFGPCQEHCFYADYINDGLVANLPAHYQYKSYFKKLTMDYASKTMFQFVSRANELEADPGGDLNEREEVMGSGLVVIEECHGESLVGNPSMVTIVNHRRENRGFVEDGTFLIRNCTLTETATNHRTDFGSAKCGPPLVVWQDASPTHGIVYDEEGFGTTRVVIDGFKTFNQFGLPDMELISDNLFETTGLGELQIWNFDDQTKWSVGNTTIGGRIFGVDQDISSPTQTGGAFHTRNWNSNNPPVNTNRYGTSNQGSCAGFDRCAGSYHPMSGPVRFFCDTANLPNNRLSQSLAWGGGVKFAVSTLTSTFPVQLNVAQIDGLQADIPALPAGVSIQDAISAVAGDISGTPTAAGPNLDPGADKYFTQNFFGGATGGYIQAMLWDDSTYFGVEALHPANTALELIKLKVSGDGPLGDQVATVTLMTPLDHSLIHNETYPALSADVAVSAPTAAALYTNLYSFFTGVNLTQLQYYRWPITKDAFFSSRTYQFRDPASGTILPPNEQKNGVTVPLDVNGHPDFANFPSEQEGFTAVSAVQVISLHNTPSGDWSIRWTGIGEVDFITNNAVGPRTDNGDDPNFVKRLVDGTAGGPLYVNILSGPVDNVRVYHPGYDPDDDENPSQPFHPKLLERLGELISPAGTIRVYDWTGERYCGTGSYDAGGNGNTTIEGWLPTVGQWPHKELGDPRQSEWPDQSRSGTAYEVMVEICNRTNRWMHWTCPHEYGDLQMTAALIFIRDNLLPGLGVVIEWGNEIWNSDFPAFPYIRKSIDNSTAGPLHPDFLQFAAGKYQRLFDIANVLVFQDQPNRRLLYVAGWTGNVDFQQGLLTRITGTIDAAGPACYVNVNAEADAGNYDSNTTSDDILDDLIGNIPVIEARLAQHKASCDARATLQDSPCALYCYEGGQSIVPFIDKPGYLTWLNQARAAQYHPKMGDFYDQLQQALDRAGVQFVCWFNSFDPSNDHFGAFGHLRDPFHHVTGDGQSPKWDKIVRNVTSNGEVRKPLAGTLTMSAPDASVDAVFVDQLALLSLTGPDVAGTAYSATTATASMTAPGATYEDLGVKPAGTATIAFSAVAVQRAGNVIYPVATDLEYKLPEQAASHARSVLAVFRHDGVTFGADRPILISCRAGSFASNDHLTEIWESDYLEWDWLNKGGILISPSVSGLAEGGLYDGYQTALWESLTTNPTPEKDAAMIVKWAKTFGGDYGGDTSFVSWAGTSSGGWIAALLLGVQRDFVGDTTPQGLESTKLDALVWLAPVVWLDALLHTFPGIHWPNAVFGAANTLADIPSATIEAVSADEAFREQGFAATTPVFMASSEASSSTSLTRDGGGVGATSDSDPTLQNALDWTVELHAIWHLAIASQTLRNQVGDLYHSTGVSEFLADNLIGSFPGSFNQLITGRFDGGVFGDEIRERASDWLFQVYNLRSADPAVVTFEAVKVNDFKSVEVAEVAMTAPLALYGDSETRSVLSATVSMLGPQAIFTPGPESATIALSAPRATFVNGDDAFQASAATVSLKAVACTSSETRYYEGATFVSVGGFVKAQIKRGNPNDRS